MEAVLDKTAEQLALRMGDNCLILAQRLGEWCGLAPELEEDIALTNIALDLIGQTRMWLDYAGELEGKGRDADGLAFERQSGEFRNVLLVEQPNDDYGTTLMRQYLFDSWHLPMLQGLVESRDNRIADIAAKAVKEVTYHLDRSADLIIRLGDGSEESHSKMQDALDNLWRFTGEMTQADELDQAAVEAGLVSSPDSIKASFDENVAQCLKQATLSIPEDIGMRSGGKIGIHGEALGYILAEMQSLPRAFPGAKW